MKHGLAGLVLVRKVVGLVLARREGDVAQHLAPTRALAFDMDHKSGALALLAQNGAQAEHRVDVARRDLHAWGRMQRGVKDATTDSRCSVWRSYTSRIRRLSSITRVPWRSVIGAPGQRLQAAR